MNRAIINKVESAFVKKGYPDIQPGQTVEVDTIIRDKDKQRIQKFRGLVISVKSSGNSKMFTVRKVSYGIGVEKTFPVNSPSIGAIKVLKYEPISRAKLYFMRERVGKAAMRIRKGRAVLVTPEDGAAVSEQEIEDSVVSTAEPVDEVVAA